MNKVIPGKPLLFAIAFLMVASGCHHDPKPTVEPPVVIPAADIWWNDQVFYEVFVRSFYDSDGNGIGDFQGIIQKLDYLNDGNPATDTDLGVTALWLMPVFPSPSYHGYDVTDYRTVNAQYGSMDDFKLLVSEAHKRGIKIVLDFVINHTSELHPWFLNSASSPSAEKRNWYVWSDSNPGYLGPWGQTVWYNKNGAFYYAVFWSGMPDLNYNNTHVTDEIEDITKFWHDIHVDGFRIDAAKHLIEQGQNQENTSATLGWWRKFYAFQKTLDPAFMTVGEVWTSTPNVAPYADQRLDYCFEFDLASAIVDAAKNGNVNGLKGKMQEVVSSYPALQYGTFLTNHDQNRVMEEFSLNVEKAKAAAGILLTLPGVPYLYYGEEVGMMGQKPDEDIRRPMQWTNGLNAGFSTVSPWRSINSNYNLFNVQTLKNDPTSLWNHYRKLIHARTDSNPLRHGGYESVNASNNAVFSFLRAKDGEGVIAVHYPTTGTIQNVQFSMATSSLPQGTYAVTELLSGATLGTLTIASNGGFSNFTPIGSIGAYATFLLKLKKQ